MRFRVPLAAALVASLAVPGVMTASAHAAGDKDRAAMRAAAERSVGGAAPPAGARAQLSAVARSLRTRPQGLPIVRTIRPGALRGRILGHGARQRRRGDRALRENSPRISPEPLRS